MEDNKKSSIINEPYGMIIVIKKIDSSESVQITC